MSSTHCFLRTENRRSICHGVARLGIVLKISHTFQIDNARVTILSTARTIMYALGPFSRKRSHIIPGTSVLSSLLLKFNIAKKCNNSTGVRMH